MFFRLRSCLFLSCVLMVSSARAGFILNIDLSTVNQVTISATTGLSAASASGFDFDGVYLKNFFAAGTPDSFTASSIENSLVYFNGASTGTSRIHNDNLHPWLNINYMENGTQFPASFTYGVQAFKGSATWNLTPTQYASFLLAPTSGDVNAFSYDIAPVIGQYSVSGFGAVPEPTSMAIFGLGGLGMAYLARRKRKV